MIFLSVDHIWSHNNNWLLWWENLNFWLNKRRPTLISLFFFWIVRKITKTLWRTWEGGGGKNKGRRKSASLDVPPTGSSWAGQKTLPTSPPLTNHCQTEAPPTAKHQCWYVCVCVGGGYLWPGRCSGRQSRRTRWDFSERQERHVRLKRLTSAFLIPVSHLRVTPPPPPKRRKLYQNPRFHPELHDLSKCRWGPSPWYIHAVLLLRSSAVWGLNLHKTSESFRMTDWFKCSK